VIVCVTFRTLGLFFDLRGFRPIHVFVFGLARGFAACCNFPHRRCILLDCLGNRKWVVPRRSTEVFCWLVDGLVFRRMIHIFIRGSRMIT
jgi:hypothetical protein